MVGVNELRIHCDGGGRDPVTSCGFYAFLNGPDQRYVTAEAWGLGPGTTNEAEYHGVIKGLRMGLYLAKELPVDRVEVVSDSQLIIRQINAVWRIKEPRLQVLRQEALDVLEAYAVPVRFRWMRRAQNGCADLMATVGKLDEGVGWLQRVHGYERRNKRGELKPARKDRLALGAGLPPVC